MSELKDSFRVLYADSISAYGDSLDLILMHNTKDIMSFCLLPSCTPSPVRISRINNCWQARHLVSHRAAKPNIKIDISVTDQPVPDKNAIYRQIITENELCFKVNISSKTEYTFHKSYKIKNLSYQTIKIAAEDKSIIFVLMSGDLSYDHKKMLLSVHPGESSIIVCSANSPELALRRIGGLLKNYPQQIRHKETVPHVIANSVYTVESCSKNELQNDPFPIPTGLTEYAVCRLLRRLGLSNKVYSKEDYDRCEDEMIGGMLPFREPLHCEPFDGSSLDTMMFIRMFPKSEAVKRATNRFQTNFVRGDEILLNCVKRTELTRTPRFRYAKCKYCNSKTEKWLEKTRHTTYACTGCYAEANDPLQIPKRNEYVSGLPILLSVYLNVNIFDDIKRRLTEYYPQIHDPLETALMLYAACKYDMDIKDILFENLISMQNKVGIWNYRTPCSPLANAICSEAVLEYIERSGKRKEQIIKTVHRLWDGDDEGYV